MNKEPEYRYVKGQGWVPDSNPGPFAVMFLDSDRGYWINAVRRGVYYDTYKDALERMESGMGMNPTYKYEIWSAEEERTRGGRGRFEFGY